VVKDDLESQTEYIVKLLLEKDQPMMNSPRRTEEELIMGSTSSAINKFKEGFWQ
jgi:hypothetical protein